MVWEEKAALIKGKKFKAHEGDGVELILSDVVLGTSGALYVLAHPEKGCVFCRPQSVYICLPPPSETTPKEWQKLMNAHSYFIPDHIKLARFAKALGFKK